MMIFSSIQYWNKSVFWSLIVKSCIRWLNIKTLQLRTMFFAASTHASHFLSFKLSFFLFLSLKLSFWILQFIEVIVCTSDDQKSSDRWLKFSYLFTHTYLYTLIIYLHLSLSSLYAYISIFISFYDHFSCLNASVLTVLIIISLMTSLILIQRVFWIFVHLCLSIYLFIHTHCMLRTCFITYVN